MAEPERSVRVPFGRAAQVAAAALVLAASAFVIRAGTSEDSPGPLQLAGARSFERTAVPASEASRRIEFTDGSRIEMTAGTVVAPVENDAERLSLKLERGRATFDVVPGGPRRWRVVAQDVAVTVVGTVFEVESSRGVVRVSVERGSVHVFDRATGRDRQLFAGDRWEVERSGSEGDDEPQEASEQVRAREIASKADATGPGDPPSSDPLVTGELRPADDSDARQWVESGRGGPRGSDRTAELRPGRLDGDAESEGDADAHPEAWLELAEAGRYEEAYDVARRHGIGPDALGGKPDRLLLLADAARLSGHPRDARALLERLVADHPNSSSAAVAAVVLGRLEMDVMERPAKARNAFERAVELGLPAALRSDVKGRLEELGASGNTDEPRDDR
jgi:transmembrane sensor